MRILAYLLFTAALLAPFTVMAQTYSLPNDDSDCPANCRMIPWLAGADTNPTWNPGLTPGGGSLPTYTGVACSAGLTEGNGTTDNASAINACISALSSGQAAVLPPGIYYVNAAVTIPSNKVLRGSGMDNCAQGTWLSASFAGDTGAGAACTTLKLGNSGLLRFSTSSRPTLGSDIAISSGYTKGSTSIVVASTSGLSVGSWISVYEQPDSAVPVSAAGYTGNCDWCGEGEDNQPGRLMAQYERITNISGTMLTLSRPLYYTFKSTLSPGIRKHSFSNTQAGLENIKVNGFGSSRTAPIMDVSNSVWSWVKNVELYHDTNTAKGFPIFGQYIYGDEIRDSYIHGQRATGSDRAYGIGFMQITSDNKIENNTVREQRHGMAMEGGGSGNVWLYNYVDDLFYMYDYTWMEATRTHGAHPYFNLYEGNITPKFGPDDEWGTSSHGVLFRNWLWGDGTLNYSGTGVPGSNPDSGFDAVSIDYHETYYALVGNVLGHTGLHTTWSNATIHPTSCGSQGTRAAPIVYYVGCEGDGGGGGSYNSDSWTTMIRHGNYDYKTLGVAEWGGGANHTLATSLYYGSKPAFFGSCSWPVFGPEGSPTINPLPAKERYNGLATCAATPPPTPPAPPTNLTVIVN